MPSPAPFCSQETTISAILSVVTNVLFSVLVRLCAEEPPQLISALWLMEGNKPSHASLINLSGTYPMMKETKFQSWFILCHQVMRRLMAILVKAKHLYQTLEWAARGKFCDLSHAAARGGRHPRCSQPALQQEIRFLLLETFTYE